MARSRARLRRLLALGSSRSATVAPLRKPQSQAAASSCFRMLRLRRHGVSIGEVRPRTQPARSPEHLVHVLLPHAEQELPARPPKHLATSS